MNLRHKLQADTTGREKPGENGNLRLSKNGVGNPPLLVQDGKINVYSRVTGGVNENGSFFFNFFFCQTPEH